MSQGEGDRFTRFEAVSRSIAEIETAGTQQDVVGQLERIFTLYGSTHWIVCGLPLPGQALTDLIWALHWPDARSGSDHRPKASDIVIQKALDWHSVFVLRSAHWGQSGLARAAGLQDAQDDSRDLLIVPIDPIYRYQGMAALTFEADAKLHPEIAMNNISYTDRTVLKAAVTAAFIRFGTLGLIDGHRKGELTLRESEVVTWCALGLTALQISHQLGITERTVVSHIQNAMVKLHASNRTECVVQAIRFNQIGVGTRGRRGFYELRTEVLEQGPYCAEDVFR